MDRTRYRLMPPGGPVAEVPGRHLPEPLQLTPGHASLSVAIAQTDMSCSRMAAVRFAAPLSRVLHRQLLRVRRGDLLDANHHPSERFQRPLRRASGPIAHPWRTSRNRTARPHSSVNETESNRRTQRGGDMPITPKRFTSASDADCAAGFEPASPLDQPAKSGKRPALSAGAKGGGCSDGRPLVRNPRARRGFG